MTDRLDRFAEALSRASGRTVVVESEAQARALIDREFAGRRVVFAKSDPPEEELRDAEVGVDRADFLLAETGTVVKSYRDRRASRISLVPPVSVFLASARQVLPGYAEAFERLARVHGPGRAFTVFITGPSRTADIEKTLVIPAHGPRELLVIIEREGTDEEP